MTVVFRLCDVSGALGLSYSKYKGWLKTNRLQHKHDPYSAEDIMLQGL